MSQTLNQFELDQLFECAMTPCANDDDLHLWVQYFLGLNIPRHPICPNHQSPFEYLSRAYHEPTSDLVVWAPRGGGKTRLAAAATLLDLLHKPGVQVRLLGGSMEQSLRVWEHLVPDLERVGARQLERALRGRKVELINGSKAAVLAQSERAVRGLRVQKLRCDEVELFEPNVWEAAQLTTRSGETTDGRPIRGVIEAMSTLHHPWGLMNRVIEKAQNEKTPIVKWCILEVLEHCPPERDCNTCQLQDDCHGIAKEKCNGFFSIDDAITLKRRSSKETWEAEMLCKRPSTRGAVFGNFDRDVHVRGEVDGMGGATLSLAIDFGFVAPFVCLWVMTAPDGKTHVVDEYVQPGRRIDEHLAEIEARRWGVTAAIACDPAGSGPNEQTAESNVALLRRRGYSVRTRRSRILEGIEQIRLALKPAAGETMLFIDPKCVNLIKALRGYHYREGGGEVPHKDGEHDHLIDALRYHYVNRGRGAVKERRY
jgi:hypothetical protein